MNSFNQLRSLIQNAIVMVQNDLQTVQQLMKSQSGFTIFKPKRQILLEELQAFEKEFKLVALDLQEDIDILNEKDHPFKNKRGMERLKRHIDYAKELHGRYTTVLPKGGYKTQSTNRPPIGEQIFINRTRTNQTDDDIQIRFFDESTEKEENANDVQISFIGTPTEINEDLSDELIEDIDEETTYSSDDQTKVINIIGDKENENIKFWLERGEKRAKKGDKIGYYEAIHYYEDALQFTSPQSEIYKAIIAKIEEAYNAILNLPGNEKNPELLFEKGEFLLKYGLLDKAAAAFRETLQFPQWRAKGKEMLRKCEGED